MRCPYCSAELEVGSIYCKVCGKELQIVPDYDPLDELVIESTTSPVKKNEKVNIQPSEKTVPEKTATKRRGLSSVPKFVWLLGLIFLGFLTFLLSYFSMSREHNYAYQLRKGQELMEDEAYEEAISYLKQAYSLQGRMEGSDVTPLRLLAEAYSKTGDAEMASACMEDAIKIEEAARGDHYALEALYLQYMELLNETRQTQKVAEVIEACAYEEIQKALRPYQIEKPFCDLPEGEYGYYITLELSAPYGSIYYTLDGTEPTEESERYETPIRLEEGETLLSAVAVNKKGMVSDKLVLVYKLNFDKNPIEESEEE